MSSEQPAHHDLGGAARFLCEAIDIRPHELNDFDRDVDALRAILSAKGLMSVDELRRGIEAIPEAQYHRLSYYERWMRSIVDNMIRNGVIAEDELRAELNRP
jgi:nitrile hydratase subunit beta